MVADRSFRAPANGAGPDAHDATGHDPAEWLTLQQAACELNLSTSTVRRKIRKGELRNRLVPRRGGFAYLVHLPGNRHNAPGGLHACATAGPRVNGNSNGNAAAPAPVRREHGNQATRAQQQDEIKRLERQVESLANALSRALRVKQVSLPPGVGKAEVNPEDPYARYRWLVRRRRWWRI